MTGIVRKQTEPRRINKLDSSWPPLGTSLLTRNSEHEGEMMDGDVSYPFLGQINRPERAVPPSEEYLGRRNI